MENKTEIMAQIVALLTQLIDENTTPTAEAKPSAPVEMLTIKECTQAVSGLSEHTVRQLVAQKKIPYIRRLVIIPFMPYGRGMNITFLSI